jgi:integrase
MAHVGGDAGGNRRSYGTGSLIVRRDTAGLETWYGQWRVGAKLVKRRLGPKRRAGERTGLTKAQAERELRRLIDAEVAIAARSRLDVGEAGERYLAHLRAMGRKRSTLMDYESTLRVHLAPFFGATPLHRIEPRDVERFIAAKAREGRATKSVLNYLGLLHSIFAHGQRRGWCTQNPCKQIDKPRKRSGDAEIRFLDETQLEALLREVPDDHLGAVERVLYLTAAMTGLRQGELLGLRWRDVDWLAGRVRVRQSFVRGEFGTPKSQRSSRSVPLADRVSAALDDHHRRSLYGRDEDLVFAHPHLGRPLDRSKLLKRFKAAAGRAGLRDVRFHDLRHTFGTRIAAAGVPMRTLQEWMGHRDFKTTLIYADYAPSAHERALVEIAFGPRGINRGINLNETGVAPDDGLSDERRQLDRT